MKLEQGYKIPCLDHGYVEYVDHLGSDARILEAARISYTSSSKGDEKDKRLLEYLWKNKHTSPFEMCKLVLKIKLPIFVMRQYVRHRMQNLNEVSARYTQLPNEFYIPKNWRPQDTKNKQQSLDVGNWNPVLTFGDEEMSMNASAALQLYCDKAYELYEKMLEVGIAREMARMVLPVNIYTEVFVCWDLKNLIHFIGLRDDSHAQAEIAVFGKAIKEIARELFPWTLEAYDKYKFQLVEHAV